MEAPKHILIDSPSDGVSRITLNRPESRNALNNKLRGEIFSQLEENDLDERRGSRYVVKSEITEGRSSRFQVTSHHPGEDFKGSSQEFVGTGGRFS